MSTGYKILWGLIAFVVFTISMYSIFISENVDFSEDKRIYERAWEVPNSEETNKITRLLIKKKIKGCGSYRIKEIEKNEFIIACSSDEINWIYYVAWTELEELYLVSDEMERRLNPPASE